MNFHQFYIRAKEDLSSAQQRMALASFLIDHVGDRSAFPTLHDLQVGAVRHVMKRCPDANPNGILALTRSLDLPHESST